MKLFGTKNEVKKFDFLNFPPFKSKRELLVIDTKNIFVQSTFFEHAHMFEYSPSK